jgi:hypothetical protein
MSTQHDQDNKTKPPHKTDVYFFDDFQKILGSDVGIRRLASVLYQVRKQRTSILSGCCGTPASKCRTRSKLNVRTEKLIQTSSSICTMCCLSAASSPILLHAWDIAPSVQASFDIPVERVRSASTFASPKTSRSKVNFGHLFTDAAHTVVGDFDVDNVVGLHHQEVCNLPQ